MKSTTFAVGRGANENQCRPIFTAPDAARQRVLFPHVFAMSMAHGRAARRSLAGNSYFATSRAYLDVGKFFGKHE